MDAHERRRLLYVAATRARDHLVVSLHRGQSNSGSKTNAELLADAGGVTAAGAAPFTCSRPPSNELQLRPVRGRPSTGVSTSGVARCERSARRPGTSPRDRLGPRGHGPRGRSRRGRRGPAGAHKGPATSSCRRGRRAATAPPSAAPSTPSSRRSTSHTGEGLDQAVAAQCLAEGVVGHADHVRALVESALATDVVVAQPPAPTGARPTSACCRTTAPSSRATSTSSTARTTGHW